MKDCEHTVYDQHGALREMTQRNLALDTACSCAGCGGSVVYICSRCGEYHVGLGADTTRTAARIIWGATENHRYVGRPVAAREIR